MRKDCGCFCFAYVFVCVVGKNPKTPNLRPMADDAITRDGVGCLGSHMYIYVATTKKALVEMHYGVTSILEVG